MDPYIFIHFGFCGVLVLLLIIIPTMIVVYHTNYWLWYKAIVVPVVMMGPVSNSWCNSIELEMAVECIVHITHTNIIIEGLRARVV